MYVPIVPYTVKPKPARIARQCTTIDSRKGDFAVGKRCVRCLKTGDSSSFERTYKPTGTINRPSMNGMRQPKSSSWNGFAVGVLRGNASDSRR